MLYLHGMGHFHPPNVLDNAFLESLDIGVDSTWIDERVGIRQRRTTLSLEYIKTTRNKTPAAAIEASTISSTQMACKAAEMALVRSCISKDQVGLVIAGGCTPEMLIPSEACRIAALLEMDVVAFDVNSACTSFMVQLKIIDDLKPETLPEFILVVCAEAFTRAVDYSDRKTAVLFGDGAAAAIVSTTHRSGNTLQPTALATKPSHCDLIRVPSGGHFWQEGHAVQKFAVRQTADVLAGIRNRNAGDSHEHQLFVGHQANLRMLETICRIASIPAPSHLSNVAWFGNCGAAGAPTVLSQNWQSIQSCVTNVVVVGAGLSWGGFQIRPIFANESESAS
jgi:3-oxoacyl-[acyl-carrier-protein] synthase III